MFLNMDTSNRTTVLDKEHGNPHDDFAIAVIKDHQIVGYIPENFSVIMWHFISHGGSVNCHITGRRNKGKYLKVPCKYDYSGPSTINSIKTIPGVYSRP